MESATVVRYRLEKGKMLPFFNLVPAGRDAGILAGKLLEIPDLENKLLL